MPGQNARKDVFDTLATMGIKIIRLGGSFCSVTKDDGEYYQWQKWRGPVWERPSIGAHWDSYGQWVQSRKPFFRTENLLEDTDGLLRPPKEGDGGEAIHQ